MTVQLKMGKRFEQTIHQGQYTDSKEADENAQHH